MKPPSVSLQGLVFLMSLVWGDTGMAVDELEELQPAQVRTYHPVLHHRLIATSQDVELVPFAHEVCLLVFQLV